MAEVNEHTTATERHCAYCGHAVIHDAPEIERFGERFCSGAHAEAFAAGVRAARIRAAARRESAPEARTRTPTGPRTWKESVKRAACWGAPLLVLFAIPLFWSGSATAATGGSILSVLALLACPLGMFFMMRAMGSMNRGGEPHDSQESDAPEQRTR